MGLFGTDHKACADERLMQMAAKGDAAAFAELYDRYSPRLFGYFKRMLGNDREKARDFVQDLFTRIIDKPHLYDPSRPFKTWVFSVAFNMCKNEYRKEEVRKEARQHLLTGIATDGGETMRKIDGKKFNELLYLELEEMDENHRGTFLLRYRDELSIREISEVFGCSEGTVKSRLFYTLRKLTPKLKMFDPMLNEANNER